MNTFYADIPESQLTYGLWAAPQQNYEVTEPLPSSAERIMDALAAQVPLAELGDDFELMLESFTAPSDTSSQSSASSSALPALFIEDPSPVRDHAPLFAPVHQAPVPATQQQMPMAVLPDTTAAAPLFDLPALTPPAFDFNFAVPSSSTNAFIFVGQQGQSSALRLDLGELYVPPPSPPVAAYPSYWPPAPEATLPLAAAALIPMPSLPTPPQSVPPPPPAALPTPPLPAPTPAKTLRNKRKRTITEDELEYHLSLPRAKKGPDGKRACTVQGCERRVTAEQLKRHLESHLPESGQVCPGCRKPFSRRDSLNRHRATARH